MTDVDRSLPPHAALHCADGNPLADGSAQDALRRALQRLRLAETTDGPRRPSALCQALTEVARTLSYLHAYSPAESHLAQALAWAGVMGATDTLADLHCAMAEVASNRAALGQAQGAARTTVLQARDRARDHAQQAVRLSAHTSDPLWEPKLLLRASEVLGRCGDHGDAAQLQQRALRLLQPQQAEVAGAAPLPDSWAGATPGRLM